MAVRHASQLYPPTTLDELAEFERQFKEKFNSSELGLRECIALTLKKLYPNQHTKTIRVVEGLLRERIGAQAWAPISAISTERSKPKGNGKPPGKTALGRKPGFGDECDVRTFVNEAASQRWLRAFVVGNIKRYNHDLHATVQAYCVEKGLTAETPERLIPIVRSLFKPQEFERLLNPNFVFDRRNALAEIKDRFGLVPDALKQRGLVPTNTTAAKLVEAIAEAICDYPVPPGHEILPVVDAQGRLKIGSVLVKPIKGKTDDGRKIGYAALATPPPRQLHSGSSSPLASVTGLGVKIQAWA